MSEHTFKGMVELGGVSRMAGNTEPATVPLFFRVNGANSHIGHAIVQVESGVLKIVGVTMDELGVRLLDLGATLLTSASPLDEGNEPVLSIRNNRPKPAKTRREELIREGYKIQGDYVFDFDGTAIPLTEARKTDGTLLFPDNTEKETNG